MKNVSYLTYGLLFLMALGFANPVSAQRYLSERQISQLKTSKQGFVLGNGTMSAADKQQLTQLLQGVNPNLYFIRFSDGTTMGRKNLGLSEVRAVSRVRRPGEQQGMTFISRSPDYIFIYSSDFQSFQSKIGEEKAVQIRQLMNKYQ